MMEPDNEDRMQDSKINKENSNIGENVSDTAVESTHDNDDYIDPDTQWSLADFPEIILVKIMKFLNLKDRYYLSVTCQRLYDLFVHPDLWKVAHINLLEQGRMKYGSRWAYHAVMPKTMSEIVVRFSHLFQHLHLKTSSIIQPFDDNFIKMLKDLSHECRLESLTLEVGYLESKDEYIQGIRNYYQDTTDVHHIKGLLRNAVRLKHLNIISWPLLTDTKENGIFQTLLSNAKLKSLESFSLFYIDKTQQWTGRVPNLPLPQLVTEVFSFLPNLTHISLRSPMLDDEVITLLASDRRKKLKMLEVLIMWSRPSSGHDGCKIVDIDDQSWRKLKMASPNINVEFVIHIRIPFDELIVMFKPEVPLSSVTILKYGQCGAVMIDSITSKYVGSLNSFVSLCDSSNCDASLFNLFKACKNLDNLVYHGDINYKTIMQMAEIMKDDKREMKTFEFKERNVKTDNLYEGDEEDDEVVIRRDDDTQEYVIAGIQSWHYDEDLHRKKLDVVCDYVKDIMGTTWSLCRD